MNKFKAIETEYNGYKFRSRLEARWAVFFDSLGIKYEYEPEGFEFEDGTKYLPDFYLPDSNQWFEVKGVMEEYDEKKIQHAIDAGLDIVVGYDKGEFEACDLWGYDEETNTPDYTLGRKYDSWLCKCRVCNKYYFMAQNATWLCRCCNAYDGDSHFEIVMEGEIEDFEWEREYIKKTIETYERTGQTDDVRLKHLFNYDTKTFFDHSMWKLKNKEKEYFDNHLWKDARMARFEFSDSKTKGEE